MRHHVMDHNAGPCLLGLYIVVEQYDVVSLDLVNFNLWLYLIDDVLVLCADMFRCLPVSQCLVGYSF